jgi:hypothetical protein
MINLEREVRRWRRSQKPFKIKSDFGLGKSIKITPTPQISFEAVAAASHKIH